MVNKYKRKTNQGQWNEDSMKLAIAECKSEELVKKTARKYSLSYTTLHRHVSIGNSSAKLGRFRSVFDEQHESELLQYLKEMVFFMDYLEKNSKD